MSERPGPTDAAIAAWAGLHRVARQLTDAVEFELKAAGLPPLAWYDALHEIAQAGEEGIRPYLLPERLLLAQYNVSRLLARLEADDLVAKLDVAGDGRGQAIRITPEGRAMRRRMWAVYGPAISRLVDNRLTTEQLAAMKALLGQLHT